MKATTAQLETAKQLYQQQGYIVIKQFFSTSELMQLKQWVHDIMSWPETTGKWLKYYESIQLENQKQEVVLSRIENFVRYHKGLTQWVDDPVLLSFISALLGEPALFFKEKLNVKAPEARGYTPHQDAPAFFDINYDAISILAPIDKMTINNGCLYFVKNGENFRKEMLAQNTPNKALSPIVIKKLIWVPIECAPGDVIIFSSYAPHYSTTNKSKAHRVALFLTFGKASQSQGKTKHYFDQKRRCFPQDSEKLPGVDYTEAAAIYNFSSPVNINQVGSFKKKS